MFWRTVLLLLSPLPGFLGRLTPDDRDREILALRQQVLILQRQLGRRPRLVRGERLALLLRTCCGFSYGEISRIMGRPVDDIRQWVFWGRRKMGTVTARLAGPEKTRNVL